MPLQPIDARMLQLIDILKQKRIIRFTSDFAEAVGTTRQIIYNIKKGHQRFTIAHIEKACKVYGVDANWILELSEEVFRNKDWRMNYRKSTLLLFE